MTDYLELLLEWEQEDEGEPFAWPQGGTELRRSASEDGQWPDRQRTDIAGGAEERIIEPRKTGESRFQKRMADPLVQLVELERTVSRSRVEQQRTQVKRQVGVESAHAAYGRTVRQMDEVIPGVQRDLVGVLDAAFERDARRYDGALGLF